MLPIQVAYERLSEYAILDLVRGASEVLLMRPRQVIWRPSRKWGSEARIHFHEQGRPEELRLSFHPHVCALSGNSRSHGKRTPTRLAWLNWNYVHTNKKLCAQTVFSNSLHVAKSDIALFLWRTGVDSDSFTLVRMDDFSFDTVKFLNDHPD